MTAINYLRKIEKDIAKKSELTNRDGRGRPKNDRAERISEIYNNILNELSAHGYKYDI